MISAACLERTVGGDTAATGRFLAALLTTDVFTVLTTSKYFENACQIKVDQG